MKCHLNLIISIASMVALVSGQGARPNICLDRFPSRTTTFLRDIPITTGISTKYKTEREVVNLENGFFIGTKEKKQARCNLVVDFGSKDGSEKNSDLRQTVSCNTTLEFNTILRFEYKFTNDQVKNYLMGTYDRTCIWPGGFNSGTRNSAVKEIKLYQEL